MKGFRYRAQCITIRNKVPLYFLTCSFLIIYAAKLNPMQVDTLNGFLPYDITWQRCNELESDVRTSRRFLDRRGRTWYGLVSYRRDLQYGNVEVSSVRGNDGLTPPVLNCYVACFGRDVSAN